MAVNDLSPLIAAKSEALEVEYKTWMDTADKEVRAKLAKHLAALHNHGGGYLIFGVDDATKVPSGPCPLPSPEKTFGEDAISAIVKRYLEPDFQCQVVWTEHDGQDYPVIIVPPHGAMPAIAKRDGPADAKSRTIGIQSGSLYIRVAGPASEPIRTYRDWTDLLERCIQHRADKLASIMRQAIGAPRQLRAEIPAMLKAVCEATIEDYLRQVSAALPTPEEARKHHLSRANEAFAAVGYALVKSDGNLAAIKDLRSSNNAVSVQIRSYAYRGWAHFLPLTSAKSSPQLHSTTVANREANYLEGMRIDKADVLSAEVDYWRIYDLGLACVVSSYREDFVAAKHGAAGSLEVRAVLTKLHSALAHARFMGQQVGDIANVVVRLDWRGLSGRILRLEGEGKVGVNTPTSDQFVTSLTLPWTTVRDDYAAALSNLALALFELFNLPDHYQAMVRNADFVSEEFAKIAPTFRLIPDDSD